MRHGESKVSSKVPPAAFQRVACRALLAPKHSRALLQPRNPHAFAGNACASPPLQAHREGGGRSQFITNGRSLSVTARAEATNEGAECDSISEEARSSASSSAGLRGGWIEHAEGDSDHSFAGPETNPPTLEAPVHYRLSAHSMGVRRKT